MTPQPPAAAPRVSDAELTSWLPPNMVLGGEYLVPIALDLRDCRARLAAEIQHTEEHTEEMAPLLPEDVGCAEYIVALRGKIAEVERERDEAAEGEASYRERAWAAEAARDAAVARGEAWRVKLLDAANDIGRISFGFDSKDERRADCRALANLYAVSAAQSDASALADLRAKVWRETLEEAMKGKPASSRLYHGTTKDCPTPSPSGACPGHETEGAPSIEFQNAELFSALRRLEYRPVLEPNYDGLRCPACGAIPESSHPDLKPPRYTRGHKETCFIARALRSAASETPATEGTGE